MPTVQNHCHSCFTAQSTHGSRGVTQLPGRGQCDQLVAWNVAGEKVFSTALLNNMLVLVSQKKNHLFSCVA